MHADHIIDLHLYHDVVCYTVLNAIGNVKIKQSCVKTCLMNSTIYTGTVRKRSTAELYQKADQDLIQSIG